MGSCDCVYAETQVAESPAPHERLAGATLMVTHQAMRGGDDMVRIELGPAFFQGGDWSAMDPFSFRFGEHGDSLEFGRDLIPSGFVVDFVEAGYTFDNDRDLPPERRDQANDLLDGIRNAEIEGIPGTFWWHPAETEDRRIAGVRFVRRVFPGL